MLYETPIPLVLPLDLVVIIKTPSLAREPYKAAAVAPFNDSLVWVDRAINATPTIHKIPAKEESEKISPRIIMAAPEMDNNLKLFFIIGFAVFAWTDARHFFKG